jgi:hypothetical protein
MVAVHQCCRILKDRETGHWGSSIGSNILLCWHRLSKLVSKSWAPRTKGPHLIYPCKQVTEARSKVNPYMVACNSIGYFTPSAVWPSSHLDSLSFISLLCRHLPPPTLSEHRLAGFFSGPPPCYIRSTWEVFENPSAHLNQHLWEWKLASWSGKASWFAQKKMVSQDMGPLPLKLRQS